MQINKDAGWDPESTASFWINRASRTLVRHFDLALRPFGFALSHLPVLRALADGRPRSQKELAQLARVEQATMTETLARMERDGVIRSETNPDDKRGKLVTLVRAGRARFPKARMALLAAENEAMAGLRGDERKLLRDLLKRVVGTIDSKGASAVLTVAKRGASNLGSRKSASVKRVSRRKATQ